MAGTYTSAQALRRLLAGTGLEAHFTADRTVRVTRAGVGDSTVYTLTPVTVTAARSRGYAAARTTSATRTDTPLRDVPQSVSVVSRDVIEGQAMQGIADVARYVPGITMGHGAGTPRPSAATAPRPTSSWTACATTRSTSATCTNVERVEALKGPNALIFGRGGGGGVLNRVSKEAQRAPIRAFTAEGGSFDHRRATLDLGQAFGAGAGVRLNGVYEESGGFRDAAGLERYGLNPTVALGRGERTTVRAGYEYFSDDRTVDRGIPSFQGRPSDAGVTTFFGNPDVSFATMRIHAATAAVEHAAGGVTLRNRSASRTTTSSTRTATPGR